MIIYKATNKINGVVYIGQTIQSLQERKIAHQGDAHRNSLVYFHRAIRKYGKENFEWTILCETDSKQKLNILEKFYIATYRKMAQLYNRTDGGEGSFGYIPTVETKRKQSISLKGKYGGEKHPMWGKPSLKRGIKLSDEVRKKISEGHKGQIPWNKGKTGIYSEEARKKIREARAKQIFPEETKLKKSIAMMGKKNHFYGKYHSEETKAKMRLAWVKRKSA